MTRRILLILMIMALVVVFYASTVRPLLRPVVELPPLPGGFMTTTLALWLFSICHAAYMLGWRQALIFFVLSAAISWVFEQVGVATGAIYGPYHYTETLGAKLGHVPLLIPIAWFMMIYPSYVIANLAAGDPASGSRGGLLKIVWLSALGAMAMTAWDLTMEPWMSSGAMRAWVWEQGGPYFGVPLQNFVGWLITTFTVYLAYRLIERRLGLDPLGPATTAIAGLPLVAYFLMLLPSLLPAGGEWEALRVIALFVMGFPLLAATGRLLGGSGHVEHGD